jgi:Protein of unknown function (DUF2905)
MPEIGRLLLIVGVLIAAVGLVFMVGARIPFLGRLPGDISFSRGNTHVYFPLATSIVLSLLLTLLLNLFFRGR